VTTDGKTLTTLSMASAGSNKVTLGQKSKTKKKVSAQGSYQREDETHRGQKKNTFLKIKNPGKKARR